LNKDLGDSDNLNDLSDLPQGDQVFAGVPFRVGPKMIGLGSMVKQDRPERIDGIRVGLAFKKLHILHATEFGEGMPGTERHVPDGTKIGEYTVHYADKSREVIPVLYGVDVRDWWFHALSKSPSRGRVAWTGTNAYARQLSANIRLYLLSWENPRPEVQVTHIDFSSAQTAAAPFCVAISAEPNR
jgi:hypothetical protein